MNLKKESQSPSTVEESESGVRAGFKNGVWRAKIKIPSITPRFKCH